MRAITVLAVFLYHAGVGWMPGGFLGVDVFFTISGYLIASLRSASTAGADDGASRRRDLLARLRRQLALRPRPPVLLRPVRSAC
ncbi:MAG TPA: hypothetical protein VGN84_03030 [Solirubrobacterales bacterium]|nr:hypothetical protein [Solirubrobacterales bacterium]